MSRLRELLKIVNRRFENEDELAETIAAADSLKNVLGSCAEEIADLMDAIRADYQGHGVFYRKVTQSLAALDKKLGVYSDKD